jgi:3-dehydroquinate synthase
VTALILTRALPILAEACVLLLGSSRMPWSRFVPALVASNFCVALSYSACGAYFSKDNGFLLAVVTSGALPLIAALVIRGKSRPDSSAP